MAVNPMQRKANNSFLLGILITLLITGLIIAFLILQISRLNSEIEEKASHIVYGYVIVDSVQSGTEITADKVQGVELNIATDTTGIYSSKTVDADGNESADQTGA